MSNMTILRSQRLGSQRSEVLLFHSLNAVNKRATIAPGNRCRTRQVKDGLNPSGSQRHVCKECGRKYTPDPNPQGCALPGGDELSSDCTAAQG